MTPMTMTQSGAQQALRGMGHGGLCWWRRGRAVELPTQLTDK